MLGAFSPNRLVEDRWCASVGTDAASFRLHPPIEFELDLSEARFLALIPFASVNFDVDAGGATSSRQRLRAGSITFAPAGRRLRVRSLEPTEALLMSFDVGWLKGLTSNIHRSGPVVGFHDRGIVEISRELRRSILSDYPAQPMYLESLAKTLLYRLNAASSTSDDNPAERQRIAPSTLLRVFRYIDDRLDDTLDVSQLAMVAGLTRAHFSRVFRESTGMPPRRFVTNRRVCKARDLLAETEMPLAEVAAAAGFASQAHMSVAFRRDVGTTPGQYRAAFR